MKVQMSYSDKVRTSPIGICWSPSLTKPTKKFENMVYSVTLGLERDDPSTFDHIRDEIKKFAQDYSSQLGGLKVDNKVIYISPKGNASINFSIKDKGQGSPRCYNEDGAETEPPIDGDTIQVKYSLAGWCADGKAGVKVYLDSVIVVDRTGKPKIERHDKEDDTHDDDMF